MDDGRLYEQIAATNVFFYSYRFGPSFDRARRAAVTLGPRRFSRAEASDTVAWCKPLFNHEAPEGRAVAIALRRLGPTKSPRAERNGRVPRVAQSRLRFGVPSGRARLRRDTVLCQSSHCAASETVPGASSVRPTRQATAVNHFLPRPVVFLPCCRRAFSSSCHVLRVVSRYLGDISAISRRDLATCHASWSK